MERFDAVNRAKRNAETSQPSTQADRTESEPTNKTKITTSLWYCAFPTSYICDVDHKCLVCIKTRQGTSGLPCVACCQRDPALDKWQIRHVTMRVTVGVGWLGGPWQTFPSSEAMKCSFINFTVTDLQSHKQFHYANAKVSLSVLALLTRTCPLSPIVSLSLYKESASMTFQAMSELCSNCTLTHSHCCQNSVNPCQWVGR